MNIKNKNIPWKKILIPVAIILIIIGFAVFWQRDKIIDWLDGDSDPSSMSNSSDSTDSENSNSGDEGESTTEQTADDSNKSSSQSDTGNGPSGSSGTTVATVPVVINDAAQYGVNIEVRAFVQGVIETDGICTFTFSKSGSNSIVKTSSSLTNPTYTSCEAIVVSSSEFTQKGTWNLRIDYASPRSKGSSSTTLEVQ